jgi:hypothetical protein
MENAMRIVNLTPHPVNLLVDGAMVEVSSTGLARCSVTIEELSQVAGIRIVRTLYGQVQGLPEPEEGTIYIVSALVLAALAGSRDDVFAPADYIRNEAGQVVGAKALTK